MKFQLGGNGLTILLREEDFTEVTITPEEVSYTRPKGTKAFIRFPQAPIESKKKIDERKVLGKCSQHRTGEVRMHSKGKVRSKGQLEMAEKDKLKNIKEFEIKIDKLRHDLQADLKGMEFSVHRDADTRNMKQMSKLKDSRVDLDFRGLERKLNNLADKIIESDKKSVSNCVVIQEFVNKYSR